MTEVVGQGPIDKSKVRRILVRTTNWVGDTVMTLPALEALRANFPESVLTVLAKPWVVPLVENHPGVDHVIPFNKGDGGLKGFFDVLRASRLIHGQGFDLAVLFQNAFEAAFITYLGGVAFRVGYNTGGRRLLLSHAVIRNGEVIKQHQVEYYLNILRAMGWEAPSKDPLLQVTAKDDTSIRSRFSTEGIGEGDLLFGLSPGAVFGPAKRWPAGRFATIGDWASDRWGAKVLIMGSGSEKEICREVSRSMQHRSYDFCGTTTLGEAMAIIKKCRFFVTNDSGLMHVAAALNVPTVALFGSTNPQVTGPRSSTARIIVHEVDCAPCLKPECNRDYRCMLDIQPEEVSGALEELR